MASLPQRHSWNISALYNPPLSCNIVHNYYIHLHIGDKSGQYLRLCTADPLWPRNYYFKVSLVFQVPLLWPRTQRNLTKLTSKSLADGGRVGVKDWFLETDMIVAPTLSWSLILSDCCIAAEQKYCRPRKTSCTQNPSESFHFSFTSSLSCSLETRLGNVFTLRIHEVNLINLKLRTAYVWSKNCHTLVISWFSVLSSRVTFCFTPSVSVFVSLPCISSSPNLCWFVSFHLGVISVFPLFPPHVD